MFEIIDLIGIEFTNLDTGLSLFFQPGDDADTFRTELRLYCEAFGDDYGTARLWETYADTLSDI